MCFGCYLDYGAPITLNERVLAMAPRLKSADPYGGLHIVVDDWNLEDGSVEFCRDYEGSSEEERALAVDLLALTEDERATAMAVADGFISETGERAKTYDVDEAALRERIDQ